MMEEGEIVEDNGPPQPNPQPTPTPAASRRPVRRTSNVRMRSPAQYPNGQYPNSQYSNSQYSNSQQGQSMPQYRGQNAPPQYYDQ
ncbi:MAG TPA: hypothetical protein VG433_16495 [Pirellulales bacterium]|jgi:hypothetical protein|nr:hypothetical protein [Pirellulales bacterium]